MAGLLFVSQAMLDSWASAGKIDFVGNVMTLLAGDGKGRSYALEPAVRFLKVLGDVPSNDLAHDPHALAHKVKPLAALRELGAEAVGDSCLLGDVAYEVEPGFLAEASALQAAASSRPEPAAAAAAQQAQSRVPAGAGSVSPATARPSGALPLPKELEQKRKEAEALARFLLENLS